MKYQEGTTPNRPPRERAGGRGSNGAPEVLVCLFSGEGVECVHLKRRPVLQAASFTIHSPEEARQLLAKTHKNCRIVGIMPKERYLIKVATLPSVAAKEEQALLAMDVEAGLPSEYGPAEVSFRRLEGQDAQKKRYEVYVCRRGDLETVVQGLAKVGLRAQAILPSAAIWAGAIPFAGGVDLLVASSRRMGWVEVASLGA
ncbi:MAG: hypothetical protein NT031_10835, partial [Planctomycetota bacterium]|nr:hypothetical protein [Planctomycetota bacterium]